MKKKELDDLEIQSVSAAGNYDYFEDTTYLQSEVSRLEDLLAATR